MSENTIAPPLEAEISADLLDALTRPSFRPLREFWEHCNGNPNIRSEARLVEFDERGLVSDDKIPDSAARGQKSRFSVKVDAITSAPSRQGTRRLLLLQNLTPAWVKALHEQWNVPLDFFLSHVEYSDWYTLQNIQAHLPVLCSVPPEHLRIQFVVAREIDVDDDRECGQDDKLSKSIILFILWRFL